VQGRTGLAQRQAADVEGVESIHILARANRIGNGNFIDMWRQRQLHQHALNIIIVVEPVDQFQQFHLRGFSRQVDIPGPNTSPFTVLALGPYVNGRGRIITHQYDCQTGASLTCLHSSFDRFMHGCQNRGTDFEAVKYLCSCLFHDFIHCYYRAGKSRAIVTDSGHNCC